MTHKIWIIERNVPICISEEINQRNFKSIDMTLNVKNDITFDISQDSFIKYVTNWTWCPVISDSTYGLKGGNDWMHERMAAEIICK